MIPPADRTERNKKAERSFSFLRVFGFGLSAVAGLILLFEGAALLFQLLPNQPIRSVGTFHSQFETKWFKLQDYVKENGGVDVLLMGNSMVNTGIDPDLLMQEYEAQTGVSLQIFNFGVEGMDLSTNAELAALLVREFHPKAIIFFLDIRDYNWDVVPSVRYQEAVWFQYKLGNSQALDGWVYDHSAAMQYFLPFRNWSRSDFPDFILKDLYRYSQTTDSGYEPDLAYATDIDVATDPNDPEWKPLFDLYSNFTPDQTRLQDLAGILDLQEEGVQVLVTEMPVYKTFFDPFGGEPVHQEFLTTIQSLTEDHQGIFVQPLDSNLVPLQGRVDNHHLNFEGAPLYSQLLGAELADLCLTQGQCLANESAK